MTTTISSDAFWVQPHLHWYDEPNLQAIFVESKEYKTKGPKAETNRIPLGFI